MTNITLPRDMTAPASTPVPMCMMMMLAAAAVPNEDLVNRTGAEMISLIGDDNSGLALRLLGRMLLALDQLGEEYNEQLSLLGGRIIVGLQRAEGPDAGVAWAHWLAVSTGKHQPGSVPACVSCFFGGLGGVWLALCL